MSQIQSFDSLDTAPLRVVMVAACPFPANHGTPGAIRELAMNVARLGHEVHVVTYPQGECLPVDGLHIHRAAAPFGAASAVKIGPSFGRLISDALLVPKLIQVIRRHRIDIIHTHNYEGAIAGAMAKTVTGKPMIYTGINSMADELPSYDGLRPRWLARGLGRLLDWSVPRAGDVLMVLSDELRDYLVERGVPRKRIIVIPPGVEPAMFEDGDGGAIRRLLRLPPQAPVVLYTGALERFQRVDLLIEAMARVHRTHPQAHLLIAGNVPNPKAQAELRALAKRGGFEAKVRFIDTVPLDELKDFLAAADIAVVPRPSCPGYPIKLLNYMAAGKAIVSFQGSAKSICDGYNGLVVANEDVPAFAAHIVRLIDDPQLRKDLGARARDSIAGVYDWETLARGTAELYREVIANGKNINRARLARYIKGSYIPRYLEGVEVDESGVPALGRISYPDLKDLD